ncbi:unnamed protein product [Linum trigynum]
MEVEEAPRQPKDLLSQSSNDSCRAARWVEGKRDWKEAEQAIGENGLAVREELRGGSRRRRSSPTGWPRWRDGSVEAAGRSRARES